MLILLTHCVSIKKGDEKEFLTSLRVWIQERGKCKVYGGSGSGGHPWTRCGYGGDSAPAWEYPMAARKREWQKGHG